ncbi:tetratricopeptide repeat protein, partial [Rhodoferax antarcticus]
KQGLADAQSNLGVMYENGQGVSQDYKEAVKWYRLAAEQGNANAQSNLGVMYFNGQGVSQSRVVAFALFNLSAANDPSADNKATGNRTSLTEKMSNKEIEAAQDLTRELAKPKNLLAALDKYIKKRGL